MRFELLFLGKTREDYLARGIDDFAGRLGRYVELKITTIKAPKPPRSGGVKNDGEERRLICEEGRLLLSHLPEGARLVALDPGGRMATSPELAELLIRWEEQGVSRVAFALGGPLGLAPEVKARADLVLSLSALTFTHEMARLLLLEQLYRAWTIKIGSGYHK
ncbi:MAG TPA: 23S rRNA (pseudouridine(1915)-N(3))-methyltransferase RlmH [Desulfurivibrio alkaliphilus]|uniref:Ribosomal RNA large subunit methyltransferase H n=1 Tax=Desulfurivibrio alkaliphilus TaxID=427923 RepID=A0A7C2XSG4_9BACT|nr:23S rRNA (pseudouridine(1915)-N(3))-methyltransferase RlmH [Desulfurivibrio alkaliphilus]